MDGVPSILLDVKSLNVEVAGLEINAPSETAQRKKGLRYVRTARNSLVKNSMKCTARWTNFLMT